MSEHAITFEELADWLDGRLEPEVRLRVEAHLATSCTACQGDLAWLRRFEEAGRVEGFVQPPVRLVAGAKASFRARTARPGLRVRRWAPALGALVLVAALALYLVRTPTVFARGATVAGAAGPLQGLSAGGLAWQPLDPGDRLAEGERIQAGAAATVTLFDGTTLAMQPGAEVALSSLRSGLFGVAREVVLYQAAGTVRYEVPPLPRGLAALRVQSPTGTVAVQGTRFVISVGPGGETTVEVLAGTVTLSGAVDSATVPAGEAASVGADAPVRLRLQATPEATPGAASGQPSATPRATGGPPVTPGPRQPGGQETSTAPTAGPGAPGTAGPGEPTLTPTGQGPGPMRTPSPTGGGGPGGPGD